MTGTLILVRHGQTHSNAARRLDTLPPGAALTDTGHEQARTFAETVSGRPAAVISSVALRARQTATYIADATGVALDVRNGLQETHVGDLEDRTDADAHEAFQAVYHRWLVGDLDSRTPGGESGREVLDRWVPVLDDVRRTYLDDSGSRVYLVGHGAAIRLVATVLADIDPVFATENHLDNTGTVELVPHGTDRWDCVRWGRHTPPFVSSGTKGPDDPMG